jgi:hypothetical protein
MNKTPLLRCLYISTEDFGLARRKLRTDRQSVESLAYQALVKIAKAIPR